MRTAYNEADFLQHEPERGAWLRRSIDLVEALVVQHGAQAIAGICDGSILAAIVAAHQPQIELYINFCGGGRHSRGPV